MRSSINVSSFLTAVIVWASFSAPACASDKTEDSTESVIRNLEDREHEAILARDTVALDSLFSKDLVVNAPRNVVSQRDEVLNLFKSGVVQYITFDRVIEFLRVDGDIATTMGRETLVPAEGTANAGDTVERRFTNVWRNEKGIWRLYIRQATITQVIPRSNK